MKYVLKSMCGTQHHENPKFFYYVGSAGFSFLGLDVPEFGSKKKAVVFNNKKEAMQAAKRLGNVEIEVI